MVAGRSSKPARAHQKGWVLLLALLAALFAGCSANYYRDRANNQVYRTIERIEAGIFGKTNAFSIDTEYSNRDPDSILAAEIVDDRTQAQTRLLTIDRALDLAVRNSRDYQSQKEQLYLTALTLTGQEQRFSPNFFGSLTPTISGTGGSDELEYTANPQLGMNKVLQSGGEFSIQIVNDLLNYYTGDPNRTVFSVMSANFVQPLLRGFGRYNDGREALTQAQRNVVYAIRSYALFQQTFSVEVVQEYFDLLDTRANLRNNYTNYLRRLDTTEYNVARSIDRASLLDVEDARFSELQARITYVNTIASYLSQLDAFKIRLGLPISEALYLDDRLLVDVQRAGPVPVEVDRDAAFGIAVERHPDILNAIDEFEDSKRKIKVAANKLKMDLNILASASYRADDPEDYRNFDPDKFVYGVGLEINLPFNRLSERNAYRTTLVQFEQQIRSLSLTLDTFKQRIDRSLRTLEQQRLNIMSGEAALQSSERRVDMARLKFEAGRATQIEVRNAQDALIEAQNLLTGNVVEYLKARLQLSLDMGVMQTDLDEFWLKDPLGEILTEDQKGPPPLHMPQDELVPPDEFLEPKPST